MLGISEIKRTTDQNKQQETQQVVQQTEPTQEITIEEKYSEAISPDGKNKITMQTETSELGVKYSIYLANAKSEETLVYVATVPSTDTLSLPFNAFSPENKFIFIKHTSEDSVKYLSIPITKSFEVESSNAANVSELFSAAHPEYAITDVTGWGGISLLIVNTDKVGGGVGPSFWYEAPTGRFYKLSTRFN